MMSSISVAPTDDNRHYDSYVPSSASLQHAGMKRKVSSRSRASELLRSIVTSGSSGKGANGGGVNASTNTIYITGPSAAASTANAAPAADEASSTQSHSTTSSIASTTAATTASNTPSSISSSAAAVASGFVGAASSSALRALAPTLKNNSPASAITAAFVASSPSRKRLANGSKRSSTSFDSKYMPPKDTWYSYLGLSFELKEIPRQPPPPLENVPDTPTTNGAAAGSPKKRQRRDFDASESSNESSSEGSRTLANTLQGYDASSNFWDEPKTPTAQTPREMQTPKRSRSPVTQIDEVAVPPIEKAELLEEAQSPPLPPKDVPPPSAFAAARKGSLASVISLEMHPPPRRESTVSQLSSTATTVFHSPLSSPVSTPRSSVIGLNITMTPSDSMTVLSQPETVADVPESPQPLPDYEETRYDNDEDAPAWEDISPSSSPVQTIRSVRLTPPIPARSASRPRFVPPPVRVVVPQQPKKRRSGVHSLPGNYKPAHLLVSATASRGAQQAAGAATRRRRAATVDDAEGHGTMVAKTACCGKVIRRISYTTIAGTAAPRRTSSVIGITPFCPFCFGYSGAAGKEDGASAGGRPVVGRHRSASLGVKPEKLGEKRESKEISSSLRVSNINHGRRGSEPITERFPTPTSNLILKAKASRWSMTPGSPQSGSRPGSSMSTSRPGSPMVSEDGGRCSKAVQLAVGARKEAPSHLQVRKELPSPKLGANKARQNRRNWIARSIDLSREEEQQAQLRHSRESSRGSTAHTPTSPSVAQAMDSFTMTPVHSKRMSSLSTTSFSSASNNSFTSDTTSSDPAPVTPSMPTQQLDAEAVTPKAEEPQKRFPVPASPQPSTPTTATQSLRQSSLTHASSTRVKPVGPKPPPARLLLRSSSAELPSSFDKSRSPTAQGPASAFPSFPPPPVPPKTAIRNKSHQRDFSGASSISSSGSQSLAQGAVTLASSREDAESKFLPSGERADVTSPLPWEGIRQRAEKRERTLSAAAASK